MPSLCTRYPVSTHLSTKKVQRKRVEKEILNPETSNLCIICKYAMFQNVIYFLEMCTALNAKETC